MPEKTTSSMLIRAIPIDIWERIDKLCRRKNMKRRDFVEQALRFFEGEEAGHGGKKSESGKPPGFDRLKRDIEELKREINNDKDKQKVEQKIDTPVQKNRIGIEQLKPENDSKLIMKHLGSGNGASSSEEKKNEVLTTVFCWGLDVRADG